jgi:hypothetical protein
VPIPEDERLNDKRPVPERIDHERIDDLRVDDRQIGAPPVDEKFEAHLRQFRPLAPAPLPAESRVHEPRRWFVFAALAAVAAAIVAVAILAFHARPGRIAPSVESSAIADQLAKPQALTIRTANALLATAPSFKDALDQMAFPPKQSPLPADKRSALAELSKEKIKL